MGYKFKKQLGDWTDFRQLPGLVESDFHWSENGGFHHYVESMESVYRTVVFDLKKAQQQGRQYVLFRHGASTSRPGRTTARSQVRKAMNSKDTTPYIIRGNCIQHRTVFVAAIRPVRAEADGDT